MLLGPTHFFLGLYIFLGFTVAGLISYSLKNELPESKAIKEFLQNDIFLIKTFMLYFACVTLWLPIVLLGSHSKEE